MYILVDDKDIIVACSVAEITKNENGYLVDGDLYINNNLSLFQTANVTQDCVQKKCFCKRYKECFGESCPHYNECNGTGTNTGVYTNSAYGDVCSRDGKELIVNQLKNIKPSLTVTETDTFPAIADAIDTMLDDATVTDTNLGEGVIAYNGYGAIKGISEVIEQFEELPTATAEDIGNVIKCGDSIYIGEEI